MDESRTRKDLDALADAYLTGPASSAPHGSPQGPPQHASVVEAVLLGHLPGFASTWVSQYARDLAERHHGATLVRFENGAVQLELFGHDKPQPPDQPLGQTLHQLEPHSGAWLILIDRPDDPDQRRWIHEIDRWTLLSGADHAAVVGAYRLLKSLVHDPHHAARPPRRGVGLSFCGCEAAAAEAAAHRLSQTARTHLSLHVEWVDSRRAMQPVNRQHLGQFNGKPLDHLWRELRGFLDGLGDSPSDAHDGSQLNDAELEALQPPAPSLEAPHDDPIDTPAGPFTLHASDATPPVQADAAATNDAESLTHLLGDLRALEARCPSRPDTELAVDADGVLHLLMHHVEGPIADALSNLLATQAWATEHAVLLSLTDPQAAVDPSAAPVAHLFTARPREAAAMAFAGGPGRRPFKLHLLKPVRVDGRTIRVHEPLN